MRRLRETLTATYAAQTERQPAQGHWTFDDYARPDDGALRSDSGRAIYVGGAATDTPAMPAFFLEGYVEEHNLGQPSWPQM